jgi:hypothetical protein
MFIPLEPARWPAAREVRDLRVSLNTPVLLGPGAGSGPVRAALGWLPEAGERSVVRLWLRADPDLTAGASDPICGFECPDRPVGPAARAATLAAAERFLAGLGFLFDEADPIEPLACGVADADRLAAEPAPANPSGGLQTSVLDPVSGPGATSAPEDEPAVLPAEEAAAPNLATAGQADVRPLGASPAAQLRSPAASPAADLRPPAASPGADVPAVRADVPLSKFRPRAAVALAGRAESVSPQGFLARFVRSIGGRHGGIET